jgi:hypothetical protein
MGLAKGTLSNVNRPHHNPIVEDIAKSAPLLSNNTLGGWVSSCVGRSPTTSTRLEDDRSGSVTLSPFTCRTGDEVHLYVVPATNMSLATVGSKAVTELYSNGLFWFV